MADRAVFLDRDDTLIDNAGYLGDPSKVKLLSGAATALAALRGLGYRLIVVTNQSGVARGMFDEATVEAVNQEMCRQLKEQAGAHIDASYYCPYHPEAPLAEYRVDHDWRKPKPGMLLQAAADFGLDLAQCWMVGDQPRDIAAGAAAGCRTILLRDTEKHPKDADPPSLQVSPNFIVRSLADAARIIAREGRHAPAAAPANAAHSPNEAPHPAVAHEVSNAATEREAAVATAVMAPPAEAPELHADALAEKVAARLRGATAGNISSSRLEKAVEDLVAQMRHQQRAAEMPPDFSLAKLAAMVLEILAVLTFIVGLVFLFTSGVTVMEWRAVMITVTSLIRAVGFLVASVFLQCAAILLFMQSRQP